eukprot:TRINITY_DN6443_c0_g2_i1.p1 TRINITY_DN6443_c0_g2~~TRINITY_DN6443_c0_g2_i1.p1  ORF type:complete len:464 (+),score=64.79 TRINITY_DN6443_c0_g2_i1:196-1587(+)
MFEYSAERDARVHNHWKLFLQVFTLSNGCFMHDNIINFFASYFPRFEDFRSNKVNKAWVTCVNFILDFVLTTPPLFLLFTFYKWGTFIALPVTIFLTFVLPFFNKTRNIVPYGSNPKRTIIMVAPRKFKFAFLDHQISTVFLLICFAILFCDTSLFDNVLSKKTRDGIGTMDLGAGLILFTSGMTSRQARDEGSTLKTRISQAVFMIWLCLNFGLIRGIMAEVSGKGDSSHGSHWSIFLILATIMLISVFIPNSLIPFSYLIAFAISLIYQIFLLNGLEDYLIPWRQHKDFFGRNAVGMCQTFGYLSCYLVGLGFGRRLYQIAYQERQDEDRAILAELLKSMFVCLAVFLFSYFALETTGPVACNLAYVSYMLVMGFFTLVLALIPERIIPKLSTNMIYEGPAKTSRLIYFTLANLLTGITNTLFDLEKHGYFFQLSVIVVYLLILHVTFTLLVKLKVNVRFW